GFFEFRDDTRDVRLLLADGDINVIHRTEFFITPRAADFVDARLIDHRVNADGRLARRTIADDQFALAAANRDHRVNRHDARLHRLADGTALDDAGRDFFHRIKRGLL